MVPTSVIEVDADIWDAVRLAWGSDQAGTDPTESTAFPVFARAGRLVLLAGFEAFLALQAAGATQVRVWRAEIEDGEAPAEYAVVFAGPHVGRTK